jgi:predicted permease
MLARWLRDVLIGYLPPERNLSVPLDLQVLLFTLVLAVGTGLLFGLAPAFASTRVDVAPALKGDEAAAQPLRVFVRKGLVVFQIGLSCVLLMAATLFLRSLHNLLVIDPGFAREKILLASIDAGMTTRNPAFYPRLLEETRRLPGVVAAGLADFTPLGNHTGWTIFIPGYTPGIDEPRDSPSVGWISPGYFETMKLPLLLGRDFDWRLVASQSKVMIVNETFAKHYFEGQNPIGRRLGTSEGKYDFEIIGVVKDGKYTGLREGPTRVIYLPFSPLISTMVLHLRSTTPSAALASAVRQKVQELDRSAPVFNVHTVEQEIDRSLARERLVGMVTGLFGTLALVLAAIGLYGVTAYGVSRRTHEFGIRMAIGAEAGSIVRLVLREAMWMIAAGATTGLAAAWSLGRVVRSMLFAIEPMDSGSIAAVVLVLGATALIAAWIPARRASRIDAMRALRYL